MVLHWILSDNKSPQLSRTLLSILAEIWMVSTCPLISKSSIPFTNPLGGIVPIVPIPISIIVTFIFHSFCLVHWQCLNTNLSFHFLLFSLGGPLVRQYPQSGRFSFFLFFFFVIVFWGFFCFVLFSLLILCLVVW